MTFQPAMKTAAPLDPEVAWTELTEAPLKGLGLAREAGVVFAWDETDRLYLLNLNGEYRSTGHAPGKIVTAAISDDGSRIAILGEGARFWLLDADLGLLNERPAPPDPIALAIDPHGRFVLVTSRMGSNHFYTRHGRPAGRFESLQPLSHALFVADRPYLIAAAAYGMLAGFDLKGDSSGKLSAELDWMDKQLASVGRLCASGDGGIILATCFTHGVQRYDVQGQNEGSYHLGGTATQAVADFAGRSMAVATLEGDLALLNAGGNVRWKTSLPRPAIALEIDPLGRYLIQGNAAGEITRLDLYPSERARPRPARSAASVADGAARAGIGPIRKPDWSAVAVASDEQAESAVIEVLDEPDRIAVFPSTLRLQVFSTGGRNLGHSPGVQGAGRILRSCPGWIAAATDRQILIYQASKNAAQRVDVSLVELTHLAIRPDSFGLLIVQERDRIGRSTLSGRWVWRQELKTAVEDIAIGPEGICAYADDQGRLIVLDPGGRPLGTYEADPPEPLSLIEAVENATPGLAWMTLARRSQVLRGHDLNGRVLWESPVAWEAWRFQHADSLALISAPDGRVQAFDGSGHLRGQSRNGDGGRDILGVTANGEARRITRQGMHLICADLDGRVRWRAVCDEPIGPVAVGRSGVAALIGRSICWFHGLD